MNNDQLNKSNEQTNDIPSIGKTMNNMCPVLSKENIEDAFERLISGMFGLNQVVIFDADKKDYILCMRLTDYWKDATEIDDSTDATIRIFTQLISIFYRSMLGEECKEFLLDLLNKELYSFSPKLCRTISSAIKNAKDSCLLPDSSDWDALNNNLNKHAKSQVMKLSFSDSYRQRGLVKKTWTKDFRKENGGKQ